MFLKFFKNIFASWTQCRFLSNVSSFAPSIVSSFVSLYSKFEKQFGPKREFSKGNLFSSQVFHCHQNSKTLHPHARLFCGMVHYRMVIHVITFDQGVLTGKTKWHAFHLSCELQRGLDLLHPDYTKDRNKPE